MFVIKAEVADRPGETLTFARQKTMYGGKVIKAGDTIFIFASENEGGAGLVAVGHGHVCNRRSEELRCPASNSTRHHRRQARPVSSAAAWPSRTQTY